MKNYIEERITEIIIDTKCTVRQAAKKFNCSNSIVHMVGAIRNGRLISFLGLVKRRKIEVLKAFCVSPLLGGGAQ